MACSTAAPDALAQTAPPARSPALAQTLFEEGAALLEANETTKACAKLAESQRLDPAPGTLLLLAECHRKEGKLATAWTELHDVSSLSKQAGQAARAAYADKAIQALDKTIPRLTITLSAEAERVPGLIIELDGARVEASLGTKIPVDPGKHSVRARAPGAEPYEATIEMKESGAANLVVPALTPLRAPPPAPVAPATPSPIRTAGVVLSVLGTGGLVAGGVLGLVAQRKHQEALSICPTSPCTNMAAVRQNEDAGRIADVATGIFVGAGAVAATGLVMVILAPSPKIPRVGVAPIVGPQGGSILVRGAF